MKKSDLLKIIKEEILNALNEQTTAPISKKERTLKANIESLELTVEKFLRLKIFKQPAKPGDTKYDGYRTDIEAIANALKMPLQKLEKMRTPTGKRKRRFVTTEEHLENMTINIGKIIKFGRTEFSTGFFGKGTGDFADAWGATMAMPDDDKSETLKKLRMTRQNARP